jgi:hypothetical protein
VVLASADRLVLGRLGDGVHLYLVVLYFEIVLHHFLLKDCPESSIGLVRLTILFILKFE